MLKFKRHSLGRTENPEDGSLPPSFWAVAMGLFLILSVTLWITEENMDTRSAFYYENQARLLCEQNNMNFYKLDYTKGPEKIKKGIAYCIDWSGNIKQWPITMIVD